MGVQHPEHSSDHGGKQQQTNHIRVSDLFGRIILLLGGLVEVALIAAVAFYLMKWVTRVF